MNLKDLRKGISNIMGWCTNRKIIVIESDDWGSIRMSSKQAYNSLLKKFPSNIVAIFCKYKEKLFFDRKDMNDEDYDDFKL